MLRAKAATDPSILSSDVLRVAAKGDMDGMMAGGEAGLVETINVSHGDITAEDFKASAHEWLTTATHPTSGLTYAGMTYQPMLELLRYLRDEDFTTCIVSGGGIDFIRAIAGDAYGIPLAGRRQGGQHELHRRGRRDARDHQGRRRQLRRRQGEQARRHHPPHRPAPDLRRRQLRRRLRDTGMDHRRRGTALRHAGPSLRRRPRVRV